MATEHIERIDPLKITDENGRVWKFCGLDYCDRKHYCRGYCVNHYNQYKDRGFVAPLIDKRLLDYPDCSFEGCTKKSLTKTGVILCSGHSNMVHSSHRAYQGGALRPLKYTVNDNYTDLGRICRVCKEDQPITEYYVRGPKGGKRYPAAKCKTCYKADIAYYQGKREVMADGSDPLGYSVNPGEKERRFADYRRQQKNARSGA